MSETICDIVGHNVGMVEFSGVRYTGCYLCKKTMVEITLESGRTKDQTSEYFEELKANKRDF